MVWWGEIEEFYFEVLADWLVFIFFENKLGIFLPEILIGHMIRMISLVFRIGVRVIYNS